MASNYDAQDRIDSILITGMHKTGKRELSDILLGRKHFTRGSVFFRPPRTAETASMRVMYAQESVEQFIRRPARHTHSEIEWWTRESPSFILFLVNDNSCLSQKQSDDYKTFEQLLPDTLREKVVVVRVRRESSSSVNYTHGPQIRSRYEPIVVSLDGTARNHILNELKERKREARDDNPRQYQLEEPGRLVFVDRSRHTRLQSSYPSPDNIVTSVRGSVAHTSRRPDGSQKLLRILLMGRTGNGKSSLGNMLLGEKKFGIRSEKRMDLLMFKCQENRCYRRKLITDTPGLCDTHRPHQEIIREVAKSMSTCAPGPHIVLMVCRCDQRFDKREFVAYRALKKLFGEDIRRYMIVIFAGVDALEGKPECQQTALDDELQRNPSDVQKLIEDASNRYLAINNKAKGEIRNRQVRSLLAMMDALYVNNGKGCFTNTSCQEIENQVESIVAVHVSEGQDEEEARRRVRMEVVQETLGMERIRTIVELVEHGLPVDHAVQISSMCNTM